MQKTMLRICSILVTVVLLGNMLPMNVFAAELAAQGSVQSGTVSAAEEAVAEIVGEDETLRSATGKHFRLSDGSMLAVNYGIPVHYQDESDTWQEIDNRPSLSGSVYTAENGDVSVAYAAAMTTGQILSTAYEDVSISMRLLDTAEAQAMTSGRISADDQVQLITGGVTYDRTATARITQAQTRSTDTAAESNGGWRTEDLIPAGFSAGVVYEDVFPGVDLEYTAYSHNIKEQIVVKQPQDSYRYDFFLELDGLSAALNTDGSVTLADASGSIIYTIPAPYMEDAAGNSSASVSYALAAVNGGAVLTVTADADWIDAEERVFPVRIDPTVELNTGNAKLDIHSAMAMEAAPATNTLDRPTLTVGNTPWGNHNGYEYENMGFYRLFVHFNNLPQIPEGSVVTNATFQMYSHKFVEYGGDELAIAAYDVTSKPTITDSFSFYDWFGTITWNNQPTWDTENVIDYAIGNSQQGYRYWDLTELAKKWYAGKDDATIAITAANEGALSKTGAVNAKFHGYSSVCPPVLLVTYRSIVGMESYYSYTTTGAGRAGTGYVNNYSGALTWVRGDLGFGGNRMPVSVSHIYNANNASQNQFGLGYGWRTNFNQQVYGVTLGDTTWYAWEDADGTVHYFYNDSGTWRDEDGLELTMAVSSSGYIITDKYGNTSHFDSSGRLYKQENNQATKSSISITYAASNSKRIQQITDGAGRKYNFGYNSTGLLTRISYTGSGTDELTYLTFTYDDGLRLATVTDRDGETSTYAYDTNNLLTAVTDIDGYALTFSYETMTGGRNSRVVSVSERHNNVNGGSLSIEYAHNQTTFTDHNGNVQIMQFNNWGNTVSVQDGEGRAQFDRYARESNAGAKGNQLSLSSKLQNTVGNLLADGDLENGGGWEIWSNTSGTNNSATMRGAYHGRVSLWAIGSGGYISTTPFTVGPGESYTFSAYINLMVGTTVYLGLSGSNGTEHTSQQITAHGTWIRAEATYTNSGSAAVSVTPRIYINGEILVDCLQLEKAPTASRYNLIDNGDFRYSLNGWTYQNFVGVDGIYTHTAAAPTLENTVVGITGNPEEAKRLMQTVYVSGNGGDTFVLSGWAKGDSAPIRENRQFGMIATFLDASGNAVGDPITVSFNPDADSSINWQYAATPLVAPGAYSSIRIELAYDYNVNTVYFDGIQLFKEQFGNSYTYDGNGNVTSVKDVQGQITTYEYTNNNLTKQTLPTGAELNYTYDNYHNVKTATTDTGVVYSFGYDTWGNNTSVSIGNGITATAAYSSDGNRLLSTTDALGKVTAYDYDADTNVLKSVQYPEDTENTKTSYTYDSMYRMASAAATTDTGTALTAGYTYEDDLLTQIRTGSSTYNFSYGNFGLRTGITIGNRTLASYEYTNDGNNYLKKLAYGNGDRVQYEYDTYGRVTGQTWEDGDTVTYKYDNSGALATVTDSATGRTTTYYYDFTDRLMKYVESGSGYSHSVGYGYDNINNLTSLVETINGTTRTTSYTYDDDNRVSSVTTNGVTESYSYDSYGRIFQKTTTNGGTTILTETYTYVTNAAGQPTSQVWKLRSQSTGRDVTYTYAYDDNGNIVSVDDGTYTTSYAYDSANQLIRENNPAAGETYTWTYDNAGNITSRGNYAYSAGALGTAQSVWNFGYNDSEWSDILTDWWGMEFTYDSMGNVTHAGDITYVYEHGSQIAALTGSYFHWTYSYDHTGMRTGRTNGTTTYSYTYNGESLSQMTVDGHTFDFYYDASGRPLALIYDGTTYYYALNLQGDVVAILDGSGNTVVRYVYNAWGQERVCAGTLSGTLGYYNPLRYRGYVYDPEFKLYYLQSRYYEPALGRFQNPDAFVSTGQGILGNNMYAYCNNNPVNALDSSGNWPKWLSGILNVVSGTLQAAAGAILGATVGWTGVGAVAATALVVNGAATVTQGIGQIANSVTQANTMREDNIIRTGVQYVGGALGGQAGSSIAGIAYDACILAAGTCVVNFKTPTSQSSFSTYNLDGSKGMDYLTKRGWTDAKINDAVFHGQRGASINMANGASCTAYQYPGFQNQYVVIENYSRNLVQASNLYDSGWIPDPRIFWHP